jgi:BASS family bile acid:Na+ symporter
MAIIVAWWGIWHIIAGLITAFIFSRRPLPDKPELAIEN